MNYEPPAWVKDYADPRILDLYEEALKELEAHKEPILEEMTQEEFEAHNKKSVLLLQIFQQFHLNLGGIIKKHGKSWEWEDYQESCEQLLQAAVAVREEPRN
jgi:hypothetical protein